MDTLDWCANNLSLECKYTENKELNDSSLKIKFDEELQSAYSLDNNPALHP